MAIAKSTKNASGFFSKDWGPCRTSHLTYTASAPAAFIVLASSMEYMPWLKQTKHFLNHELIYLSRYFLVTSKHCHFRDCKNSVQKDSFFFVTSLLNIIEPCEAFLFYLDTQKNKIFKTLGFSFVGMNAKLSLVTSSFQSSPHYEPTLRYKAFFILKLRFEST